MKITIDEAEIILEALNDYKLWFEGDKGFEGKIKLIDKAINRVISFLHSPLE